MRSTGNPSRLVFISLTALLFTGACSAVDPNEGTSNFLLITIDTLRADRLGVYGNGGIETPAIDRLAAEGVRFAHAVTAVPTTLPSHASLLTGATPPRHGLRDNAAGLLPPEARTLAEAFQTGGYRTGAFVSAFVLDARWGLAQGFETYDGTPVVPGEAPSSHAEAERLGAETLAAASEWLAQRSGESWFLWLHLFDPHAPYAAPEPFGSRYRNDPYDGEVAYVDSLIGRLRDRLEELGMWNNTTVVLTSDHGEALGQHGEPAHGFFLYEATLRVPLIVRVAYGGKALGAYGGKALGAYGGKALGADSWSRGAVVDTPVALIDVFSTAVDMWGLDRSTDSEGRSLTGALRGEALEAVPIYSETMLPRLYFGWADLQAMTSNRSKFIAAPRAELYDLDTDPAEVVNLAADNPDDVDALRGELSAWVERSEAAAIGGSAAITDPDRVAALRSLGYLGVAGVADAEELADPKDKIAVYAAMMAALGAWELGDTEQALAILDGQIAADPGFAGAQHFRGLVLAGSGRYDEATLAFERALEVDPGHALASRELARAYRTTGDLDAAIDLLGSMLALQPTDVDLRWELVDVLMRANRWNEVREGLQEGLAMAPDAPELHLGVGLAALQDGAPQQALDSFDRAAVVAPGLPNLQYRRGETLERLGRTEEALAAYEAEAKRQPRHYAAQFSRARLMAANGAPAEGVISALRAAVGVRPQAPEAALFLAQTLVDQGDIANLDEAERLALTGLANVEVPQLRGLGHATLAQIYEAQGRPEEAQQQRAAAQAISRQR